MGDQDDAVKVSSSSLSSSTRPRRAAYMNAASRVEAYSRDDIASSARSVSDLPPPPALGTSQIYVKDGVLPRHMRKVTICVQSFTPPFSEAAATFLGRWIPQWMLDQLSVPAIITYDVQGGVWRPIVLATESITLRSLGVANEMGWYPLQEWVDELPTYRLMRVQS